MTTVLLTATSDTFVAQNVAGVVPNAPSSPSIAVNNTGGGVERLSYIYFNSPFPAGATVLSAKLRLYQRYAATGGSRTLTAKRVAAKWSESTISYTNKPAVTASAATTAAQGNGGTDGRLWEFDVTAMMQEVSDGAPWFGFRIGSNNTTLMYLFSSNATGSPYVPTLEVEWSDAPEVPVSLSPGAGRSVSIARPYLRFDFRDFGGDTTLSGYKLQISSTNSFTPTVPTPIVNATSDPQHLMTTDIVAGTTYYWRVNVIDGAGLESGWSAVETFTRTNKPTVSITNPSTDITEPTPPIAWSVSGGTQSAYQVFITDPVDTATVLWTSGKVTSASTSITLPEEAGRLLSPGGTYGLTVRVWDTVSRESTPGDPVYKDTSKTFGYATSGGTAVTSLVATAEVDGPNVTLTWDRGSYPDSWTVLRDGVTVAMNILPGDTFVSGTSHAWVDRFVSPRTDHTWQVIPVVNGVASGSNPTSNVAQTRPTGVWLSTLDGSVRVCLSSDADNSRPIRTESNELSAVHSGLGASSSVVLTQTILRPKGSSDGVYLGPATPDVLADDLAAWETLVGRRSEDLSLVWLNKARRVNIYNTFTGELDEAADWNADGFIDVAFSFLEVG